MTINKPVTGIPTDVAYRVSKKLKPSTWDFLSHFLKNKSKKIKILDVGCSRGDKMVYLLNKGYKNIFGIDYCKEIYEPTLTAYPKLNIKNADAQDLNIYTSEYFDVVYCYQVLEHLPKPELAIKEANRVLKSRGAYLIGIPNGHHLNDILMRFIQIVRYGRTDHLQQFSLGKITNLLKKYNFEITEVRIAKGSIEIFKDARIPKFLSLLLMKIVYPLCKKIYWRAIGFDILAVKK